MQENETQQAADDGRWFTEGLGPRVTAWVCEYRSGEVFVSLAEYPMNDPDVRAAWRLLTLAERDSQVAQAVVAERERCSKLLRSQATELSRLRETLNFIATHFSSDWPERCQTNVLAARHALTQGPND